jgi:carbamoyltransferase
MVPGFGFGSPIQFNLDLIRIHLEPMGKLIVGISANYHDSAFSILDAESGNLLFAESEERFTRIKGDSSFPNMAIKEGLEYIGASKDEILRVGYYEKPILKLSRIAVSVGSQLHMGSHRQLIEIARQIGKGRYLPHFKLKDSFPKTPIDFHSHHMSHAASSYYASGFDEATILTVDGVGEWETMSIFMGRNGELKKISNMKFPHSLGLFYATFTAYCGFKVNSGEYKLMGLAPFGQPNYVDVIKSHFFKIKPDGTFKLNMKFFEYTRGLHMFNDHFEDILGGKFRASHEQIDQRICDVAASAQVVLEEIYLKFVENALHTTGIKKLCLAGGVALNCVANSKLSNQLSLEHVFIQPAAGDAGGSLGAAYLSLKKHQIKQNVFFEIAKLDNVFKGKNYELFEIRNFLSKNKIMSQEFESLELLDEKLASLLMEGKIIGLFRGRSEFGPRSLGCRSILASASDPQMQRKLNYSIKKRESFRPFAPVVLYEEVSNWFKWEANLESPYMLFTAPVNPSKLVQHQSNNHSLSLTARLDAVRSQIPAVTHVDNSARIQTVATGHPLRNILKSYYKISGCPVLVNTSFNVRGEPIVETPEDAINCLVNTDIDYLAIENYLVASTDISLETRQKFNKDFFVQD